MVSPQKLCATCACMGILAFTISPVRGDVALPAGTQVFNPAAVGTPYTTVLPSWVTAGNLIATLVANMTGDFTGTVTSKVYWIDAAQTKVGFTYVYHVTTAIDPITLAPTSLDSSSYSGLGFAAFNITDVGADGSGSSHTAGFPPISNGDPLSIARHPDGHPKIEWNGFAGASLQAGDTSAVIFFATDAPSFFISSTNLADANTTGKAAVFAPIPAPSALLLGLIGLAPLAWRRRKV